MYFPPYTDSQTPDNRIHHQSRGCVYNIRVLCCFTDKIRDQMLFSILTYIRWHSVCRYILRYNNARQISESINVSISLLSLNNNIFASLNVNRKFFSCVHQVVVKCVHIRLTVLWLCQFIGYNIYMGGSVCFGCSTTQIATISSRWWRWILL